MEISSEFCLIDEKEMLSINGGGELEEWVLGLVGFAFTLGLETGKALRKLYNQWLAKQQLGG